MRILHARRIGRRCATTLTLFGGWTWVAASSLVGFEVFELIFSSFALAPELLPLVIITLAAIWFFRDRTRRLKIRARARIRLARALRRADR